MWPTPVLGWWYLPKQLPVWPFIMHNNIAYVLYQVVYFATIFAF